MKSGKMENGGCGGGRGASKGLETRGNGGGRTKMMMIGEVWSRSSQLTDTVTEDQERAGGKVEPAGGRWTKRS